jgi:hypothetical protein
MNNHTPLNLGPDDLSNNLPVDTAPAPSDDAGQTPTEIIDPSVDDPGLTLAEPPLGSTPVAVVTPAEAAALSLTPPQRTAIVKLTSGSTHVEAATAAGVSRMTLYRWLKHDPAFQCAFNAWQKDVVTTAQGQLLAATRDALSTVLNAIRQGDARLAWKLLESQGITTTPKAGPTDVAELERREVLEKRKKNLAERQERSALEFEELTALGGI